MNIHTPFVIITSDRYNLTPELNAARRDTFRHQLAQRGLSYKEVQGVYKGSHETAYLVLIEDAADEHNALRLARRYGQESALYVDANRAVSLYTLRPEVGGPDIDGTESLGMWAAVHESVAKAQDAYTYSDGTYYVAGDAAYDPAVEAAQRVS